MCIATMKTVTAAHRAQRALAAGGIEAQVVSLDSTLTRHGCAYGISYPCKMGREAERIMARSRIGYGQIIGG
ncbi:MAG: DUF3343 domain-containing protein [Clostridia bacterium]|nr:DUF3343 domain-containing protein [Clostridia bacterium]